MLSLISEELAAYVEQHTSPVPDLLRELRQETLRDLPYAQMQVGPVEGTLLRILVGMSGARRVLELGTFSGYSALCMAAALPDDGRLLTCDIDPVATAVARRYFDRSPHGKKIELRLGDATQTLDELARAGARFDFAFIDADKENYATYFERSLELVRVGGLVAIDNVLWSGKVADPEVTDADTEAIRSFNAKLKDDERVSLSLVPIGDGLTLARKR
jgi:caffeoyl-CoA O-methyltransferase